MDRTLLSELLAEVAAGRVDPAGAAERIRRLTFADLGFARVDHHRAARNGFPEVVYAPGKSVPQLEAIVESLAARGPALVTRLGEKEGGGLSSRFPDGVYDPVSRTFRLPAEPPPATGRPVLFVTAGTTDIPVAEEGAVTARMAGCPVERLYDAGVAGIHRLLADQHRLARAGCIVVVAGMEGALPGVVKGLVAAPVVAVPTSIGYGAAFGGVSALLTMLNACAPGIGVVNIDNGFGAGYLAALIARGAAGREE